MRKPWRSTSHTTAPPSPACIPLMVSHPVLLSRYCSLLCCSFPVLPFSLVKIAFYVDDASPWTDHWNLIRPYTRHSIHWRTALRGTTFIGALAHLVTLPYYGSLSPGVLRLVEPYECHMHGPSGSGCITIGPALQRSRPGTF